MSAPVLSRRLQLEGATRVADGAGGYVTSWAVLGAHWAEVRAATAREIAVPGGVVGRMPLKITVRASAPGTPSRPRPDQRFREGARVYQIAGVAEMPGRADYLICYAIEEASQ